MVKDDDGAQRVKKECTQARNFKYVVDVLLYRKKDDRNCERLTYYYSTVILAATTCLLIVPIRAEIETDKYCVP